MDKRRWQRCESVSVGRACGCIRTNQERANLRGCQSTHNTGSDRQHPNCAVGTRTDLASRNSDIPSQLASNTCTNTSHPWQRSTQRLNMFQDTLVPVDTRIRAQRDYVRPKLDLRYSQQLRTASAAADPKATQLMQTVYQVSLGATMHASTQIFPKAAPQIRKETNAAIHDHEREQKACVFALRNLEAAANQGITVNPTSLNSLRSQYK